MKRKLFLKWILTTVLAIGVSILCVAMAVEERLNVSIEAKVMLVVIAGVYIASSAYLGLLSWNADALAFWDPRLDSLDFMANWLPYIGMFGAIFGILTSLQGNVGTADVSHLKEAISQSMAGIGISFIPTLAGIFFGPIMLSWQTHILKQSLA